jgi:hypothetical protein
MEPQMLEAMLPYACLLRKIVPDTSQHYYEAASSAYLNTGENANQISYADFGKFVTNEITQSVNTVNGINTIEGIKYGMLSHMQERPDAYEKLPEADSNYVNVVHVEAPGGVERHTYMEEGGNILADVGASEEDPDFIEESREVGWEVSDVLESNKAMRYISGILGAPKCIGMIMIFNLLGVLTNTDIALETMTILKKDCLLYLKTTFSNVTGFSSLGLAA